MISTSKKKVLVLQPEFDLMAPRSIRIHNVFKQLTGEFDIQILKFQHPSKSQTTPNITFHNLTLSTYNSTFVNNIYNTEKYFSVESLLPRFTSKLHRDYIYFPDIWASTHTEVMNYFSSKAKEKIDIIYASMFPFSTAELASKLKSLPNFKDSKVILDIGDPLTYNAGTLNKASKRKRRFEQKHLTLSDKIIVTNKLTKEHYIEEFKIDEHKIHVIPQGVDTKLFTCEKIDLDDGDQIKLCYAGIFYEKLRSPKAFFEAIVQYKEEHELQVSLYGCNYKSPTKQISVFDKIPQTQLVCEYNKSHVLLFFDNAFGIQLSGKIFELLATKKPILFIYSNPDSEALKLVSEHSHVIKVRNQVGEILTALRNLPKTLKAIKAIDYDVSNLSWEGRAIAFKSILNTLN